MRNYVKDNRSGVITEMIKHKPGEPHAKGVATLQLINAESGEVDVEVRSENIVMDWIAKHAFNVAFSGSFGKLGLSSSLLNPFQYILLTDWNEAEKPNTPTILGRIIGWAGRVDTYAGSDISRGTINAAETTYTTNSDGQLVARMVFDFPTHAANGTFQSIQWARNYSDNDNGFGYSYSKTGGRLIVDCNKLDDNVLTYLYNSSQSYSYDSKNDCISVITNKSTDLSSGNPYYNTSRGYKFKMGTSEITHEVEYRTEDGISYNAHKLGTKVRMTSDNKTVAIGYYTSNSNETVNSQSVQYAKAKHYTIDIYNTEGIRIERHFVPVGTFQDSEGNTIYNPKTEMCDIMLDGTIRIWGYTRDDNTKVCKNFVFYYNPFEKRITKTVSLDKFIKVPNSVERPDTVYIHVIRVGENMCQFTFGHTKNDNTAGKTFHGIYDISNTDKIKHLNDLRSYNNLSYYVNTIQGADFAGSNSTSMTNIFTWHTSSGTITKNVTRISEAFAQRPSAHTLLASPVTKTQSHTMKVTYEIICDTVDLMDTSSFFSN